MVAAGPENSLPPPPPSTSDVDAVSANNDGVFFLASPISRKKGGGFSPRKLRTMLMGLEKKRKEEEEELESTCFVGSELSEIHDNVSLSQHDSSVSVQSATAFVPPPSTARSVSMRDMGTEMTPIASQEPSRTGTPVTATTPIWSPRSSRPSSPGRSAPMSSLVNRNNDILDLNIKNLSEKEMQMKTRSEIMALGKQLGKPNIAAWASKEVDTEASTSRKTLASEQPEKSVLEARAAAWEEAEKAKYMARFKREEIKIEAWENHRKAMTEAEMRKTEVEVERIRGRAHDRLMNKLAALRHKAEERRAAAEAKRSQEAAKTDQQADYIRRTGRIPPSTRCCCF